MAANFYIAAGGEGQRLRPLTEYLPKPLLPIANRDDGTTKRIIDTPVSIGRALDSSLSKTKELHANVEANQQ